MLALTTSYDQKARRSSARHTVLPPDVTDDAGQIVVHIQHRLAPLVTVIRPKAGITNP